MPRDESLVHRPRRMQQAEGRICLDEPLNQRTNPVHGHGLEVNLPIESVQWGSAAVSSASA